jgi:alkylhydroperoxidase/carboxymuconolactone decarboxylase family protein YurZ
MRSSAVAAVPALVARPSLSSRGRALDNGVTREELVELVELVTHLAFHGGWPVANSAVPILRRAFEDADAS